MLESPTPVQRLAIPRLLGLKKSGCGVTFAAATGSGKTLAYLLPVIQALKGQELLSTSSTARPVRVPKRPRALVMVPTRELATQIVGVLKTLSHHGAKVSSELVIGGDDYGRQRRRLEGRPVDVLVATPGRLVKHLDAGHVYLGSVTHLILDEVDTMLEQGFQADVRRVLHPLLYGPSSRQQDSRLFELVDSAPKIILTTATLTNAVKRLLGDKTAKAKRNYKTHNNNDDDEGASTEICLPPNMPVLEAPGLHRAVPTLQQIFVDVGSTDKLALLTDAIKSHSATTTTTTTNTFASLTLVFCNTVASCRAAEHALVEAGVQCLCYHGELNSLARADHLRTFREARVGVLVCTDMAARGLDVPAVDHVLMFDFPLNPLDYLHRAGRTARAGSTHTNQGKVTALVAKRDKVLAKAIEDAVVRGDPLDSLTGRKTDYLPGGTLGKNNRKGGGKSNGENQGKKRMGNSHSKVRSGGGGGGSRRRDSRQNW